MCPARQGTTSLRLVFEAIMDTTTSFTAELAATLHAPFAWDTIDIRPGAAGALWAKDGSGALALAYADPRVYQARLDAVVGPPNWSVEFLPWGETRLICRLMIFGIAKSSTGEADPRDPNAGTVAEAQAFKRACAAFGLGRFLYELPQVWARGSGDSKTFKFDNPDRIIAELRRAYERTHPRPADAATSSSVPASSPPTTTPVPMSATRTPPPKQATARRALEAAERRTGLARS
jgi:hypothetical protein